MNRYNDHLITQQAYKNIFHCKKLKILVVAWGGVRIYHGSENYILGNVLFICFK